MNFIEILEYNFIKVGDFQVNLLDIIAVVVIIIVAKLTIALLRRLLERYFKNRGVDQGRRIAVLQFLKYIIYVIALLTGFEAIGISLSVLWGGAAALMVGIGLGLQQTFNDLVSGIILLIEGSVDVGDIVEVDGKLGRVTHIGIRTSQVETRDSVSILIPNSKLVGDKMINWSHNSVPSRFAVNVGVAYSSDIDKVTAILFQAAEECKNVLRKPEPEVQFVDFGNSSLDFVLFFYCEQYLGVESIKSDLRYGIKKLFKENGIEIPFPQHDLWIRNPVNIEKS